MTFARVYAARVCGAKVVGLVEDEKQRRQAIRKQDRRRRSTNHRNNKNKDQDLLEQNWHQHRLMRNANGDSCIGIYSSDELLIRKTLKVMLLSEEFHHRPVSVLSHDSRAVKRTGGQ